MIIGKQLMACLASTILVGVAVTASSVYSIDSIGAELAKSTGATAQKMALTGNLKAAANGMRTGQRGLLLNALQHDKKGLDKTRADYSSRVRNATELMQTLKPLLTREQDRLLARTLEAAIDQHATCFQRISELCDLNKIEEASAVYRETGAPAGVAMETVASQLMDVQTEFMKQSGAVGIQKLRNAHWISMLMSLCGILLGVAAYVIVRGIIRTLRRLGHGLEDQAREISNVAGQVEGSSRLLAQGACEQTSTIAETSTSISQITATARNNSENSRLAAEVMATVDENVKTGNRRLDQMVLSMTGIASSSDRISNIIRVIDEIAFQTNILALNAAVEAARAGQAGLGFAVVADEVRNLAQRSARAAKDTAALIEQSIANSNQGVARVRELADVMQAITDSSAKVKTLVDQVSVSSQAQTRDIDQIARGIAQMDDVTRSNAAGAQQTSASGGHLSVPVQAMHDIVSELWALVGDKRTQSQRM